MWQVLRYTLYNKERSTFVDASFLHNDWWQRVRDLFNPPTDEGDEEVEECKEGDPECEEDEEEEEEASRRRLLLGSQIRQQRRWLRGDRPGSSRPQSGIRLDGGRRGLIGRDWEQLFDD